MYGTTVCKVDPHLIYLSSVFTINVMGRCGVDYFLGGLVACNVGPDPTRTVHCTTRFPAQR